MSEQHAQSTVRTPVHRWLVAAIVALTVGGWELLLLRAAGGESEWSTSVRLGLALDAALVLAVALIALVLGAPAARWLGIPTERALPIASIAYLLLLLLLVPAAIARESLLELWARVEVDAAGSVDALSREVNPAEWLCSSLAPPPPASRGVLETARANLEAVLLLLVPALPALYLGVSLSRVVRRPRAWAAGLVAIAAFGATTTFSVAGAGERTADPKPAVTSTGASTCPPDQATRRYEISAVEVNLTLNRVGDHVANAFIYVLDRDLHLVRRRERLALPERVSVGLMNDPLQPLVIRANVGECVEVRFTNRLPSGTAGLVVEGLPTAGETMAWSGETVGFTLRIPGGDGAQRAYLARDPADDDGRRARRGLFGAFVVEPAGAVYRSPETGTILEGSRWDAIIDTPAGPDFREFVFLHHSFEDEREGVVGLDGRPTPAFDEPSRAERPGSFAVNYRSEPLRHRFAQFGVNEAQAFSSYFHGDPVTPIARSYLGDPVRVRVVHGAGESFHVHHVHGGMTDWEGRAAVGPPLIVVGLEQGRTAEEVSEAHPMLRINAQATWPGTSFNAELPCGAGGCQRAPGDALYRCTSGSHTEAGEWGLWRVFDTLQPELAPLPDRAAPPRAVTSLELVGRTFDGRTVRKRDLREVIEPQLPPRGERLHALDASVWDWSVVETADGPLYVGEPESHVSTANFRAARPGERSPILFNPDLGRPAWPMLRPHPGKRPPFSPRGHTGAPWLGELGSAGRRDGVCPSRELVPGDDRRTRVISVVARDAATGALRFEVTPANPVARVHDCVDLLFANGASGYEGASSRHPRPDVFGHFFRFDPQASDGWTAGFSFAQDAEPFRVADRRLTRDAPPGDVRLPLSRTDGLRPGVWIAIGLGEGVCEPDAASTEVDATVKAPRRERVQCTEIRRIASIDGDVVNVDEPLAHAHAVGSFVDTEFVRFHWYSDARYRIDAPSPAPSVER